MTEDHHHHHEHESHGELSFDEKIEKRPAPAGVEVSTIPFGSTFAGSISSWTGLMVRSSCSCSVDL